MMVLVLKYSKSFQKMLSFILCAYIILSCAWNIFLNNGTSDNVAQTRKPVNHPNMLHHIDQYQSFQVCLNS